MTLREKEDQGSEGDRDRSTESASSSESDMVPVDNWERPDDWKRISSDDLPEPEYDEYSLPEPEDLTEVPADEVQES